MHITFKKTSFPLLKAVPVACLIILIVLFCVTALFIYRNIYLTIAQMETVEELERTVARERLNRVLWNQVLDARLNKLSFDTEATSTPVLFKDPFAPR